MVTEIPDAAAAFLERLLPARCCPTTPDGGARRSGSQSSMTVPIFGLCTEAS
jgi:hypothetical protein